MATALLITGATAPRLCADEVTDAKDVLAKHSLTKSGPVWQLPVEVEAVKSFAKLAELEKKHNELGKKYLTVKQQSIEARKVFDQTYEEYKKLHDLLENPAASPAHKQQIVGPHNQRVAIINKIRPLIVELEGSVENAEYQKAALDYMKARHELTLALLKLKEALPKLTEQYQELKANEEVTTALKTLGASQRLGPAKAYKLDPRKSAALETQLLGNTVPLLHGKLGPSFSVMVNERGGMLVTYRSNLDFSFFQTDELAEVGIKPDENAQRLIFDTGEAKLECLLVKVPQIRLGKYVLTDVDAAALPPQGKSLGNVLGKKAIAGFEFDRDLKNYTITFTKPSEDPPPPPAKGAKKK